MELRNGNMGSSSLIIQLLLVHFHDNFICAELLPTKRTVDVCVQFSLGHISAVLVPNALEISLGLDFVFRRLQSLGQQ
jgi:hypothetical protein